MSAELLIQPDEEVTSASRELNRTEAMKIGGTIFEALAVDAASAIRNSERAEDSRFTMSVTRIPGGQTVPDER